MNIKTKIGDKYIDPELKFDRFNYDAEPLEDEDVEVGKRE